MNLSTLRTMLMLRGGEIRAWALTRMSYDRIVAEVGDTIIGNCILGIPVVIVRPDEPEGVIV